MINVIIITNVAIKLDSGPNVPPPMIDCEFCPNENKQAISFPLTLKPNK